MHQNIRMKGDKEKEREKQKVLTCAKGTKEREWAISRL